MAVHNRNSVLTYLGNKSTSTPYPVTFPFLLDSDIKVSVKAENQLEPVLLVQGAGYTLNVFTDSNNVITGGEVVTSAAYNDTHTIFVYREIALTQTTELPEFGPFPANTLELSLDKVVMMCQQLYRSLLRCVRVADFSAPLGSPYPQPVTLFGLSGDGGVKLYTASDLLSLLSLGGSLVDAATANWSDDGERALKVPDFERQLGVQADNNTLWRSTGLVAGNWAQCKPPLLGGQRVLGRVTGSGGAEELSIQQILGFLGGAEGDVIYRGSSSWGTKKLTVPQVFTASGNWTKPFGASWVTGILIAPGGGGGSGPSQSATADRRGGGGGAGGGVIYFSIPASLLATTLPVVIGAAGVGGAAVVNSFSGLDGTKGGNVTFAGLVAQGGWFGGGGLVGVASGGGSAIDDALVSGFSKGPSCGGANSAAANVATFWGPGGGGGGGNISSGAVYGLGGAGAAVAFAASAILAPAGAAAGFTGGNGATSIFGFGSGGGGGSPVAGAGAGAGRAGGNGGLYGGGGGGGSASLAPNASGAGGNGGAGIAIIASY